MSIESTALNGSLHYSRLLLTDVALSAFSEKNIAVFSFAVRIF